VNSVTIYTDVDQSLEFTVVPTLPESDLDTKLRTDGYEYEWRYVAGGNTGNINNTTVLGREATYRLTTKDTTGLVKCIVKNKLGDMVSETPFVFLLV
jgi:hypothetical protein